MNPKAVTRNRLGLLLCQGLCWISILWGGIEPDPTRRILYISVGAICGLLFLAYSLWWSDRGLLRDLARHLADQFDRIVEKGQALPGRSTGDPLLDQSLARVERTVTDLRLQAPKRVHESSNLNDSIELDLRSHLNNAMTRSGLYDPASALDGLDDSVSSPRLSTGDMVNRLDPRSLKWLESSVSEQAFLGWSLKELREKSFLEIIHPDDRDLAKEQLRASLVKGEAHGLIYRIKTANGESKAIQVNVGVRTGPDRTGSAHLRCHLTDVTAKVKASRELRRRTRELTQVNQQLRAANRELEELKDRYSDLYQNAPAMYFSLDQQGRISECNNSMLTTLGYARKEIIGKSFAEILPAEKRALFKERFEEYRREGGRLELEGNWIKANGEVIDVFLTGTVILNPDGSVHASRAVAQDMTARRALEAALRDKNQRLGVANAELSRKIKELDEFSHVVSHDLQEPLRTLTAFSDFLIRDYGDRLDSEGKEYVQYIVEASRRMRALIQDLLALSRAGKVTTELNRVELDDVYAVVKADLAELVRTKGAELRIEGDLPAIWGDRDRLVQLFMNLVGNGLKYNKSPIPTVSVRQVPSSRTDSVCLVVEDNGIGIDPQFHSRVFQLFRRLHTRDEYEGTGAGLAICQKIVQAHGGTLWLESELEKGSKFFVQLSRPTDGV